MLETIEAWITFVLILIFFGTILACFLMWYASGLAGIEKSGFWRSLASALFASVASYLSALAALVYGLPVKTLYGLAAGLLISLFIIKGTYKTSLPKAFIVWLFFVIAQAIIILVGTELFIGSLNDLIELI